VTATSLGPSGAPFRKISSALYLVAVLLVLVPLVDFATSVVPYLPGSAKWRFASVSLFSGFLLTPLLGFAMMMWVASVMQHRRVIKLLAILSLLGCLALIGACGILALDVIELRAGAEGEVQQAIVLSGTRALLKNVLVGLAFLWLAVACRQALKVMEPPRDDLPMSPIVGGRR
jgi:hypothetical protein